MTAPVLLVGDLHLGRTPHRIASATGLPPGRLGPAEAWRRTVEHALEARVQAVVLAGDVVDQDEDRFEAWSELRDGVRRLVQGGVAVLGVAGNHDHLALPRLAQRIPDFTLLGTGGRWERVDLDGLDLLGWSFPQRHHRGNPLDSPGFDAAVSSRRPGLPAIGVLHADLDASGGPYAPVASAALREVGLDGWFLGHIHKPGDLSAAVPVGYLGSLVGLSRGETGPRGPWLLQPDGGRLEARQVALGPVYWTEVTVDLSGLPAGDDALDRVVVAVEEALTRAARADAWLQDGRFSAVGVTVRVTGRTAAKRDVRTWMSSDDAALRQFVVDGVPHAVVRIHDHTRPDVDLDGLATERTPVGRLARVLVALEAGEPDALPPPVAQALTSADLSPWTPDPERHPMPDPQDIARQAAWGLLDQLLEQRPNAEVG